MQATVIISCCLLSSSGWSQGTLVAREHWYVLFYAHGCHTDSGLQSWAGGRWRGDQQSCWLCHCSAHLFLCLQLCLQLGVRHYIIIISFVNFSTFFLLYRPIAWVVTSEIFPLDVRGVAVSITTASNWTGNFIVAMLTPVLILCSPLDVHGTFFLLSGALLLGFLFVLLTLPETKVLETHSK